MKIAVIGAGFFGCVSALKLRKCGHDIDLFEEKDKLFSCASGINQYRLHSGYHYPRSIETAQQCISGLRSIKKEYGDCLQPPTVNHYYAIANDSKVSLKDYVTFLHECELEYRILNYSEAKETFNTENVQCVLQVVEDSFDIFKLKNKLWYQLTQSGINLKLNTTFIPDMIQNYDVVINATYTNSNFILSDDQRINYQFELCEKPIVKIPPSLYDKSIVIVDGEFGCIDPTDFRRYCVMGHVNHAIHCRSTGQFPIYPKEYNEWLNAGICHGPTNVSLFFNDLEKYLPDITSCEHIGSMYTIRTVLPEREYDDARPSYITKHNDQLYSIFSGKLGTAVDIANELVKMIKT